MKKIVAGLLFLILNSTFHIFSQSTSIPGLFRYKLDNGLELFVMENDSAPLAYIEIAVRAGAVTQTAENAGLFHLYEHMMFKGNEKYSTQEDCTAAMNKMGVSSWNGTTSIDRVNYFFTVPSQLLKDGLEFWSYAVRTPKIDEKELENEKSVVLSEIEGGLSEPGRIFGAGVFKQLFAESPWRMDTSGDPKIIKNATVEQLRQIQKEYYVPQNTGLFVGGDVKHEEVFNLVKEIYGQWKNGPDSKGVSQRVSVPSKNPFREAEKIVFPDPRNSKGMSQLVYYLRGPDAETDEEDTYAADIWSYCLGNPSGSFIQNSVENKNFNIPDADYTGANYTTMRASGMISFSAAFLNDDKKSPVERANLITAYWKGPATENMLKSGKGFDSEDYKRVNKKIADSRIYSMETAEKFLSGFSSQWATSGADYYLNYDRKMAEVTVEQVHQFVNKYVKNKNGLTVLFVNPDYYAEHKTEFVSDGWKELNADNARWWK